MTNSTIKASVKTSPAIQIVQRCNDLIKRREDWEVGAYKASNDQLYEILASAYELYLFLVNSAGNDERKTFSNVLKAKNVSFQSNTPLHTRVVRLVFATNRKRAYTYGRVLFAARKENIAYTELPNWIRESSGVEEVKVRSNGKLTPAEKAKADAEFASDALASGEALLALGKVHATLKPDPEHNPIYSLALVRCDNGADAEIVWGTANAAAIAKVPAIAGKSLRATAEAKVSKTSKRNAARTARTAISSVAKSLKATPATTPASTKLAA